MLKQSIAKIKAKLICSTGVALFVKYNVHELIDLFNDGQYVLKRWEMDDIIICDRDLSNLRKEDPLTETELKSVKRLLLNMDANIGINNESIVISIEKIKRERA